MGRPAKSAWERFRTKFSPEPNTGCWLWYGATGNNLGYGRFRADAQSTGMAHRFSYEYWVGPIPEGTHIDHLCRQPACVNPDHLEPVVPRENTRRGESPWAVAHRTGTCKDGTPLVKDGKRQCAAGVIERRREKTRLWRLANKEAIKAYNRRYYEEHFE